MSDDSECTKTTYINLTIQKKESYITWPRSLVMVNMCPYIRTLMGDVQNPEHVHKLTSHI